MSHIWALLLHTELVRFYQVLLKSQNLECQVTHRENKETGPGSDLFHVFIWETAFLKKKKKRWKMSLGVKRNMAALSESSALSRSRRLFPRLSVRFIITTR